MISRACIGLAGAFAWLFPASARAEPVTTAWLEDVHLPPAGKTETLLAYEHESVDLKATAEGYDQLDVEFDAGVHHALTLAPAISFRQRGEEPLRLDQVGFRAKWLAVDRWEWPALMVYGGYGNDLDEDRDHLLQAGAAARYTRAGFFLNADVRPGLNVGGAAGTTLETWYGLGLGYGRQTTWSLRAGLELFAVVPVVGERLSDPTFGASASSSTFYYGPSVAYAIGPFSTALSAVTGYPLSDGASQFMLRGLVGVAQ